MRALWIQIKKRRAYKKAAEESPKFELKFKCQNSDSSQQVGTTFWQ
jgi:hypothetical protein